MATWHDLVGYVRSKYKIADEKPNMIKMVFETGNLRSQVVFLWQQTLPDGEWVQIESPFAPANAVDLGAVLAEIEQTVCGALAMAAGHLTIRHAVPLGNLNINEFETPLALVTTTADRFERMFVGADRY